MIAADKEKIISVVWVDADRAQSSILRRTLEESDYRLLARVKNLNSVLESITRLSPDLLLLSVDILNQAALELLVHLKQHRPLPVVIFAEQDAPQVIEQAVKAGVSAYVINDFQPQRLASIVTVAMARFSEYHRLSEELELTKYKLAERKALEKAKGLLMQYKGISEEQAYQSIRKMAMDKGDTLAAVAESVIGVMSMLQSNAALNLNKAK